MIREAKSKDAKAIASIYNHYILNSSISFEENPVDENIIIEIKQSRNWYSNIFEVLVEREKKENQFANNSVLKKKNKINQFQKSNRYW